MKVEVNLSKKYALVAIFMSVVISGLMFAYAYNSSGTGGTPSVFGHSVDEINWSQTIPLLRTNQLCLSGDCKSAWPTSSGGSTTSVSCSIPNGGSCFLSCPAGHTATSVTTSCSGGNVQPLVAGGYSCQSPTTVGCSCSASCTQNPTGTAWSVTCPTGQVLKALSSTGVSTCVADQTATVPNTCTYDGREYSPGSVCWTGSTCGGNSDTTILTCSSGSWSSRTERTTTPCKYSSC